MFRTLTSRCLAYVVASTIISFGSTALATDAVITNYSNSPVYVARAKNRGPHIVDGWTTIFPNETKTFSSPDSEEMYLRVERDGGEIVFTNHQFFLNWAVNNNRFAVDRAPLDPSIVQYRWGMNYEHSINANFGAPPPAGWDVRRFFAVGVGLHNLEIKP